mgnify:FL=1
MQGLIIKSTGSSYLVHFPDGTQAECHVKGNFRIRGIRSTNPVAVGDHVEVATLPDGTHWITDVCERRNYIIRRSTNLSKESHIIAANIDQVVLLVTVNHPVTSTTFIDRFLATCEAYRVPAVLLFNKIDLLNADELQTLSDLRTLYESLGYPTYALSAKTVCPEEIEQLKQSLLYGKVTLLSGNSGVGKSTLLNVIFGRELARTGAISNAHNKGTHTTTFSEMYPLPQCTMHNAQCTMPEGINNTTSNLISPSLRGAGESAGWLIDTPGIKGFGTIDMQKEEIGHYFREIFRISAGCRYSNCTHTGEPGCAVCQAALDGTIAPSRFESYLSLLGDCTETKYR